MSVANLEATVRAYIISRLRFQHFVHDTPVPYYYHRFLNHSRHYSWKWIFQVRWCKNQLLVTYRHVDLRLAKAQIADY